MLRLLSILGHAAIGLHDSALNLTEVAWMPETLGVYIGGPSLSVLPWDPAQIIVSSNVFGPSVDFAHTTQNASIHRSTDYGASFAAAGVAHNHCDGTLFTFGRAVYILGPQCNGNFMQLSRSADGLSWPRADQRQVYAAAPGMSWQNAPTPVAMGAGRIWRAVEQTGPTGSAWGDSVLISAPLPVDPSTNLLSLTWQGTKPVSFAKGWPAASWPPSRWGGEWGAKGWLEGGAVVGGADDDVHVVLRVDMLSTSVSPSHAVLLKYDKQEQELKFEQVLDFPGGHSKFAIHFDNATQLYLTLSNNVTAAPREWQTSETARLARSRLSLSVSRDLRSWTTVVPILVDDQGWCSGFDLRRSCPSEVSYSYTGFQYADFHFDGVTGEDLVAIIRTGYRGANTFHNSNRITFKRLKNWRSLLSGLTKLEIRAPLAAAAMQPRLFDSSTTEYRTMVPAGDTSVGIRLQGFGRQEEEPSVLRETFAASFGGADAKVQPIRNHDGGFASLPFPFEMAAGNLSIFVTTKLGDGPTVRTTYRVVIRRAASVVASVAGQGFEMRTAAVGAPAWRDRKWTFASLPPALLGLHYTALTCAEKGGSCGPDFHPPVFINATVHTQGVLFAVTPVAPGCGHVSCGIFELAQKEFGAQGWELCNLSATIAVGQGGQPVATTDLVVMRAVVDPVANQTVVVPRSSGFMIALFVP